MSADRERVDRQAIRRIVEDWVVWRDAGDWERFRTVWHDGGRMLATWFQGSADEFIHNTVKTDMPGLTGPEVEALYARGAAYLDGEPL